jgi:hypothetical protein
VGKVGETVKYGWARQPRQSLPTRFILADRGSGLEGAQVFLQPS